MAINPMEYSSKDVVLDVVRTERDKFYEIIDDPDNWRAETRCEGWEVRDLVGHMIDVSEAYLERWELAENGEEAPPPLGWQVMAETLNEGALAHRELSREEAIARLKSASDRLMEIFENLSEEEWNNFMVSHVFSGPTPAFCYPAFQIMDYGVHSWDMRWGLGEKDSRLDERTAGVLLPYMFIIWQYSVDPEKSEGVEAEYGIKVDGEWGGQWKASIRDGQFEYEPVEDLGDLDTVFHYEHPSDMVLTTYQRIEGGEATGDPEVIDAARNAFFHI
ncbi:MAG TPA: maleylpyruvate isomerase family mycothiol-dependent enzyme [Candidatus Sulfomarinibacteraceae bacterium]|nr:maleylpyruvate isomerase family mycothiol-dependent enzyme [Candidatus Sulfomarinibacteraceae bacterium]